MKRTFIFSILTLAFMMICQSAFAYDYYVNGIYYRKVTQQLPGGGCGETYLIVVNDDEQNTYSGDVVIPETETINGETYRVRYIGSEAFFGCINLTSVTLPSTIVNIGYHSFADCHLLEYIELPAGMQQINSNAFSFCYELDYIFIHSTEPFFLWDDAFADINDHVHIIVPCNCIEAFEAAEEWQGIQLYDDCGNVGIGENESATVNIYPPCNCIEAFEASEEWQGIQLYDDCGNVGVGENESATVNIYPNPATETLTIEAEGLVTIVD